MLFNSVHFFVFFAVVTGLYFALPHRFRWSLLLLGSCYFYMAFVPVYILILGFTIVVDYFAGIWIEGAAGKRRKLFLILSLIANIGVLSVFKYYNFINENLTQILGTAGFTNPMPILSILLPIGLSFHTFQAMSYTIEVYRGRQQAEKNFGIYALYVMFYPQLVAGPIERPQNLLHQFHERYEFDYQRVTDGLKLMGWGLFKKVVIADRLAAVADPVFGNPGQYQGMDFVLAAVFFTYQIYCDFSGYSDMAVGSAQVMGFKLMRNFRQPYLSRSVGEFWTRWHISLSTWFRDYLYIPLGGNRVPLSRWYVNVMIVFLVSGLWHGANWTFVVWGGLHGLFLISGALTKDMRAKIARAAGLERLPFLKAILDVTVTFILVTLAWVFFRAKNVSDALYVLRNIFETAKTFTAGLPGVVPLQTALPVSRNEIITCFALIIGLEAATFLQAKYKVMQQIYRAPLFLRWPLYYAFLLLILFMGKLESKQFIYFQF